MKVLHRGQRECFNSKSNKSIAAKVNVFRDLLSVTLRTSANSLSRCVDFTVKVDVRCRETCSPVNHCRTNIERPVAKVVVPAQPNAICIHRKERPTTHKSRLVSIQSCRVKSIKGRANQSSQWLRGR